MIERHVPSTETCLRLWESGFPQESEYYWWRHGEADFTLITHEKLRTYRLLRWVQDWYAAPILTEILEQLPKYVDLPRLGFLAMFEQGEVWGLGYGSGTFENMDPYEEHENPTEAAALLWIKLKEENA